MCARNCAPNCITLSLAVYDSTIFDLCSRWLLLGLYLEIKSFFNTSYSVSYVYRSSWQKSLEIEKKLKFYPIEFEKMYIWFFAWKRETNPWRGQNEQRLSCLEYGLWAFPASLIYLKNKMIFSVKSQALAFNSEWTAAQQLNSWRFHPVGKTLTSFWVFAEAWLVQMRVLIVLNLNWTKLKNLL